MKPSDLTHRDLHEDLMKNRQDIELIQEHIAIIKNNHLHHIERDMDAVHEKVDRLENKIDRVDNRIWAVMFLIIGSILVPVVIGMFN
jgi:uncharacterized protein Yka (UPF0111/DUF47 family)